MLSSSKTCALLACGAVLWVSCAGEAPTAAEGFARQGLALEVATWTPLKLPTTATARAFHGTVYDDARQAVVVFGGRAPADNGVSRSDSGLVDGSSWAPLGNSYGRRGYVAGAFDSARARLVTYGGFDLSLLTGTAYYAETWELVGSSWTLRSAAADPGKRDAYGISYDARRKATVLFGGFDGTHKDDLYEWNGSTWTQRCATAPCSAAPRPSARSLPVFVYDPARGVTVLFGGRGRTSASDDTWTWNGSHWALLVPASSPSARAAAAAAYDPVTKRVLMFGGVADDGRELNDFWAWDGTNWTSIAQTTTPAARKGATMAWHAAERRGILLGGTSGGLETDAWTFTLGGSPCGTAEDCHAGTCTRGTCSSEGEGGAGGDGGVGGEAGGSGLGGDRNGDAGANSSGGSASGSGGSASGSGGSASGSGGSASGSGGSAPGSGGYGGAGAVTSPVPGAEMPGHSAGAQGLPPSPGGGLTPSVDVPSAAPERAGRSLYSCGVAGAGLVSPSPLSLLWLSLLLARAGRHARRRAG
jgi:hypothetical protein